LFTGRLSVTILRTARLGAVRERTESDQQAARHLLERLWEGGGGCLSVQVLQEFLVTVTKKVAKPLPVSEATARVREFSAWRVFAPTAGDVLDAIALHVDAKIGFWDAMVVLAVAESGRALDR
jgi:predicted nucleic acid-binding protein